jgi:DNA-binding MarR family transcriptional regulator
MALFEFPMEMRILRYLNRYDAIIKSEIAKDLDVTYSHTVKLLFDLEKEGLVIFSASGRFSQVSLTPKGRELAELLDKVMSYRNIPVVIQRGVR